MKRFALFVLSLMLSVTAMANSYSKTLCNDVNDGGIIKRTALIGHTSNAMGPIGGDGGPKGG